ncbi:MULTISPECIES: protein kinase [unclassified Streptomyces]|uniref:protein kinase domain-containing protein n=1 Tax=unclassified Streptomyces TaxID=2593676 RepID=UPI0007015C69|nr:MULTISPECIES: protein kinase [unclassified Streptomyces]KQX49543.1 serine/threonine protein kinase [Streptomyces sp. Root1304]KRA79162.1 serine/threonine protein kinase [Streptomyces sp. Root66D1]
MSQDGAQGRYAGGSVAGGRYQLRDLLGEGGMASVYLAYDSALDRQVAIKTLHTELGREQSFRERFRREAQAVAKLSHTNIVSVFDTGEDALDGAVMPYIVMEYVEGQPLGSVLAADVQQYGAMPADKALKVTADVLAALEVSHEMGLVHRDIKPGNVMTTKRGVVKVMDFGIARAMQSGVTSMTQTGMVVGTPQYLSPEQALGRAVDARSDLYSVGIMLFQLLTGRLPFDADSPLAIAYAHVQEEPVAPSTVNRSVTPAMDALVARALRKNPNERFPSAAAMRDECLRVLSAGQTGAPMIVQGGPVSSGAGVGSAVFPPIGQTPPPGPHSGPHGVQQPYAPTPAPGPYGPATPAPAPSYGYPQQAPTPAPMYQHQQAPTPAPYAPAHTSVPAPTGGGSRRNTPVIVGAIVVALLAIGGLVFALTQNDDPGNEAATGGTSSSAGGTGGTEQQSSAPGHKGPDLTKTIDPKKCTQPTESSDDPEKFEVPNFTYKNIQSVKDCVRAAGWKIMTQTPVDESTYGEGTVLEQYPPAGEDIADKDAEFTLKISTGNPPQ